MLSTARKNMLRMEDFVREFPVNLRTDRDAELPLFLEYLDTHPVDTFLDVGAHYSVYNGYASKVRKMVKRYDGIDIIDDPESKKFMDNFYVGNAIGFDYPLKQYDMVACISTIEHAGVSTYKMRNIRDEQDKLFARCLEITKKYLWISFPTGLPYVYPDELSVITEQQLTDWESVIKQQGFKLKERFLHNQAGPQFSTPWREYNKRTAACKQQYFDYAGNQSITVMEVEKA